MKRSRSIALAALAAVVVAAAVGGWLIWRAWQPYQGYPEAETFVEIPPGSGVNAIGRRLVDAGVVRDRLTFRIAVLSLGADTQLKAGEYRFAGALSARDVVSRIARGDVYLRPITFPEGLTIREMAALFEAKGFGRAADFIAAASDPTPVRAIDPDAPDLEGYLFPETYNVPRRADAKALVAQMVARFLAVFGPPLREAAAAQGLGVREAVTLASLVEKETAKPEERPLVAAVYTNRLRAGMGMQADPSVIYALQKAGRFDGNLTRDNLQFDSPYNTYRYAGLPPGPIANPGRASLEAAVKPAQVDYLFFVSRNDGSHVFSRTYDEHRRHVHEFQVRYFRNRSNGR